MRYRLTEAAVENLEDIFIQSILEFGELQAFKYEDSLRRTFDLLTFTPELGRKAKADNEKERRFVHGSHVIFYRIEPEEIIIESVEHGALIRDPWGDI